MIYSFILDLNIFLNNNNYLLNINYYFYKRDKMKKSLVYYDIKKMKPIK